MTNRRYKYHIRFYNLKTTKKTKTSKMFNQAIKNFSKIQYDEISTDNGSTTGDNTPKSCIEPRSNVRRSTAAKTQKIQNKKEEDAGSDSLMRNKLNEVEAVKFLLFIAMNVELVCLYAFKNRSSDKKGSVLKGFYKAMQSFLTKSKPEYIRFRSCSILRGHLHRILPDIVTYKNFLKNCENQQEWEVSGDKINKKLLSKMILTLFEPEVKAKLIELRDTIVDFKDLHQWYELEENKLKFVVQELQKILPVKITAYLDLTLQPFRAGYKDLFDVDILSDLLFNDRNETTAVANFLSDSQVLDLENYYDSLVDHQNTEEGTNVMTNHEEHIQNDICYWQEETANQKIEEENYDQFNQKQDYLAVIHCNNENEVYYNQNYNFGDQPIFYNNEINVQQMDLINESIFSESDFYNSSDCVSVDTEYLEKCEEDLDVKNQDEQTTSLDGYFTKPELNSC